MRVATSRPELKNWLQQLKTSPYWVHTPTVKQCAFLLLDNREALFGGAAGGGKSDALLMAALQYADVPGYAAILFRRTFTELSLPEGLMTRSFEWLSDTDAEWHDREKTWHFPGGGTLSFGYLESKTDRFRYQGAAFQFVGFDELTAFPERDYTYLFSRQRRLKGSKVPVRMRAASNPGGIGHRWVKRRFITDPMTVFIPSLLQDNPHLDQEEYEAALVNLDPVTRAQLRAGNWDITALGNMFKAADFRYLPWRGLHNRIKDSLWFWDFAGTDEEDLQPGDDPDWTAGLHMAELDDGSYVILNLVHERLASHKVEKLVRACAESTGPGVPVRIEQEPGQSGKAQIDHYARTVLKGFDVRGVPSSGDKATRARPVSAAVANGLVHLLEDAPWTTEFLDEVTAFPALADEVHDDIVDTLSGAHTALQSGGRAPEGKAATPRAGGKRRAARRRR